MIAIITFTHRCSGSVISVDETYAYPFCETLLRLVLSEYKRISDIRLVTKEEWDILALDNVEYRNINDEYYTYPGQRAKLEQALKKATLNLDPGDCEVDLTPLSGTEICITNIDVTMKITERDLNRITDSLLKEV